MDIGKTYRFWGRCTLKAVEIDHANGCIQFEHIEGEHQLESVNGRIPIGYDVIEQGIKTGAIRWIQSTK